MSKLVGWEQVLREVICMMYRMKRKEVGVALKEEYEVKLFDGKLFGIEIRLWQK